MEQRQHLRVPVGISTLIYRRALPIATGVVLNASRCGAFLGTECLDFHQHQQLQFEFCLSGERAGSRHRVTAHVLRRTREGVALEIDEADSASVLAIGALLGAYALTDGATLQGGTAPVS